MFKKKNPVKKLEVNFDERPEQKININIKPLVTIEKHESRINGKVQAPEFRISIGGRDIVMLNSREYDELFSEMLRRMDNDEIMHALFEKHAMEHAEMEGIEKAFATFLGKGVVNYEEILENLNKQADAAVNG